MDAIFRSSIQTPVRPARVSALRSKVASSSISASFDPAQIAMQVLAATPQVDDRITDQLPGSMIGGLAAAVDREKGMRQMSGAAQTGLVRRAPDGVDRLVLEKKKFVA